MTHVGYIVAGWGISLVSIALYAWSVISRGRTLGRQVPAEKRRWISSDA